MRDKLKSIQLFVHKYYTLLVVALVIAIFGFALYFYLTGRTNRDYIIEQVRDETKQQTAVIEQQFRALCVVIIETSGTEGLRKLDDSTQDRCKDLGSSTQQQHPGRSESQEQLYAPSPGAGTSGHLSPQTPSETDNEQAPGQPDTPAPGTPQTDNRGSVERVTDPVIRGLDNIIGGLPLIGR